MVISLSYTQFVHWDLYWDMYGDILNLTLKIASSPEKPGVSNNRESQSH